MLFSKNGIRTIFFFIIIALNSTCAFFKKMRALKTVCTLLLKPILFFRTGLKNLRENRAHPTYKKVAVNTLIIRGSIDCPKPSKLVFSKGCICGNLVKATIYSLLLHSRKNLLKYWQQAFCKLKLCPLCIVSITE